MTTTTTIPSRVLARGSAWRTVLAPVVFGGIFIGLWQLLVTALEIEPSVVPSPAAIVGEFVDNLDPIVTGSLRTGGNALIGLVVGTVVGVLAAIVASQLPVFDRLGAPLVAALSVMPIVALAPVLYTMYGAERRHRPPAGGRAGRADPDLPEHPPRAASGATGAPGPDARVRRHPPPAAAGRHAADRGARTSSPACGSPLRWRSSRPWSRSTSVVPSAGLGQSITSAASQQRLPAWPGPTCLGSILLGLGFYCVAASRGDLDRATSPVHLTVGRPHRRGRHQDACTTKEI